MQMLGNFFFLAKRTNILLYVLSPPTPAVQKRSRATVSFYLIGCKPDGVNEYQYIVSYLLLHD